MRSQSSQRASGAPQRPRLEDMLLQEMEVDSVAYNALCLGPPVLVSGRSHSKWQE